jgi:hypothetical protein
MPLLINPDFSRLPEDLGNLFVAAAEESFFNHPAWYEVFQRHATSPGVQVRAYTDSAARAALVLQSHPGGGERRQTSLANYYSCEHAPLLRAGAEGAAAFAAIGAMIAEERPRWDAVSLVGLDPAVPTFGALEEVLRGSRMVVRPFFDFGVWFEETAGLSFADYANERPTQLRNTWKRKRKKLAGGGRLQLAWYTDLREIEQGIADYQTIYRSSWKEPEPHPHFLPALMRVCAALGVLRLGTYRLDGAPAAAQFWILWRGRATIFKLAHDERFAEFSLGTLLTMEMMERVLEIDRPTEINFGRGDDPYKKLWLPRRRERWGMLAANPRTPRGLALALREKAGQIYRRLRPATHDGED